MSTSANNRQEFDVFFFSMRESYAEANWQQTQLLIPEARRIDNISPPWKAWVTAAQECRSDYFFSIDADNRLLNADFLQVPGFYEGDRRVHVWRCQNVVNGLVYGHGAVKFWPKDLFLNHPEPDTLDFTSGIVREGFCIQPQLVSLDCFNTDAFMSFRAAFKECYKLITDQTIYAGTQPDPRTPNRLLVWGSLGRDVEFGEECILGARLGMLEGLGVCRQNGTPERSAFQRDRLQAIFDDIDDVAAASRQAGNELREMNWPVEEVDAAESVKIKNWLSRPV